MLDFEFRCCKQLLKKYSVLFLKNGFNLVKKIQQLRKLEKTVVNGVLMK